MIAGIGVDVVSEERFLKALDGTPALRERLFLPGERPLAPRSLAARFAAKEAALKALGDVPGFSWQQIEVVGGSGTQPRIQFHGAAADVAARLGVTRSLLSLSHDAGLAVAMVVLEAEPGA